MPSTRRRLFFVAGNVDLAAGTRVVDDLGRLGRRMPFTAAAGFMAGLSMAGIPLSFGYVAKDVMKIAKAGMDAFPWVTYASIFVSAASVAAAGVATVRVFWPGRDPRPAHAVEGSPATWLPPLVIATVGIVLGLYPAPVERLLTDAAHAMGPAKNIETMLADGKASGAAFAITIGLGVALFFAWDLLHRQQQKLPGHPLLGAAGWYAALMSAIPSLGTAVTRRLQGGSLPTYLATVLSAVLLALGLTLAQLDAIRWPSLALPMTATTLMTAGAVLFLVGASIAVCVLRNRFVMLLVSGTIGLSSALLFLALGAPDVAFTQLAVEVAFVVVLAAILLRVRRLDLDEPPAATVANRALRAALALGVGAAVAALVLIGDGFEPDPALTEFFATRSVPEAYGRNVVNVVLVDYRAVDTLGEIIVVTLTFLAALPLLRLLKAARRPAAPPAATGLTSRALMLDVLIPLLYPLMLVAAAVILLRGHNEPGGGFIAGMVAVSATAALAVAKGSGHALSRIPLGPLPLAAASALLSLASGLPALALGDPYMTHLWTTVPLGVMDYKLSTVLAFDLGVFGAVWGALGGLAARAIALDERTAEAEASPR
jgi:multicomponent Na+:H+ antiporter subunit A